MTKTLPHVALILLLALLPQLSVVAGKTWPWQGLLVVVVAAAALLLWGLGKLTSSCHPERCAQDDKHGWRPDAIDLALAAFIALQALSLIASVYRFATGLYLAKVLAYAIAFWLVRYGLRDRRWWRAALWCLMSGGLLLAVIGLQEYIRTVRFLGDASWRVFGPMFNPNIAAGYLLLTIFPAVALLLGSESRAASGDTSSASSRRTPAVGPGTTRPAVPTKGKQRNKPASPPAVTPSAPESLPPRYAEIAGLFSAALMFVTCLLTGSKAALGALLLSAVVFALVAFRGGGRARFVRLGILAFVGATILLAFALPPLRVRLLSAFGTQSQSSIFRVYTWQATVEMIKARPLQGFGGGAYENIQPRYAIAGFTRAAHQSYLQLAAECGLPALLAGLVWGTLLLRGLWRRARSAPVVLERLCAAAALAGLFASSLQQLVDYAWNVPAVGLSFFVLAGLGLSGGDAQPSPGTGYRRTPVVWAVMAVAALLLVWSGFTLTAAALSARADAQIAAGDYTSAVETLTAAARLSPSQADFPVQIAKLQEAMAAHGEHEPLAAAIQARQRAVALQPTEPVNYLALSRLYEQGGDLPSALKAVEEGIRWYPTYPRGLAQKGRLQDKLGQHEAALATFRRLIEVYQSPVGQVQAVDSLTETAYAHAFLALGDEARRAKDELGALRQYRQAVALLTPTLRTERQMSAPMKAAGQGSWGHLEENSQLAAQTLERLRPSPLPVSTRLMVELQQALGDEEEAQRLARYLLESGSDTPAARLLQAWATLTLAQSLPRENEEKARELTKKGLEWARQSLPKAEAAAAAGWETTDTQALETLMRWAENSGR